MERSESTVVEQKDNSSLTRNAADKLNCNFEKPVAEKNSDKKMTVMFENNQVNKPEGNFWLEFQIFHTKN